MTAAPPAQWADQDEDEARLPPHDIDAERVVLGAMMQSGAAIGDVLAVMDRADYYRPAHQILHDLIIELSQDGKPHTAEALVAELIIRGEIGKVGGGPYVLGCIERTPTWAMGGSFAQQVRELAVLRRLIETGATISQLGWSGTGDGDADELAAHAVSLAEKAAAAGVQKGLGPVADALPGVLERIENPQREGRIPTGLSDLDALLGGGFAPGQMVIIAARPAIGKSVAAINVARWAAYDRPDFPAVPTLLFTLEMSRDEVLQRMLAAEGRVPLHHIREGGDALSSDDWDRLNTGAERVGAMRLWVDDDSVCTIARAQARFMELARAGNRPGAVIFDYAQLVTHPGRFGNRQEQVADMSRRFKLLAMLLRVPVIVLVQLNRGPEQRTDKRPMLSDMRESGAWEQDADIVILLHREDAYERESPRAGEADWIVAKHRNGPTSTITCAFQGHYSRFTDMARGFDPAPAPDYIQQ